MNLCSLLFVLFYLSDIQMVYSSRSISSKLALGLCKLRQKFSETQQVQNPLKRRLDVPSKVTCGWFRFPKCKTDHDSCPSPEFVTCSQVRPRKMEVLNLIDFGERKNKTQNVSTGTKGGRVVGGVVTRPHEFPSIVSINMGYSWKVANCGGTIIDKEWILTAAHCIVTDDEEYYEVVAGEHIQSVKEGTEQHVLVTKIIIHEQFDGDKFFNDIALLKVSPAFTFNNDVALAALPEKSYSVSGKVQVAGWGRTKHEGPVADVLQKTEIPFINDAECRKQLSEKLQGDLTTYLMLDWKKENKMHVMELLEVSRVMFLLRFCSNYDSGGPLYSIKKSEEHHQVIGVVSFGIECANPKSPGVYTEVTYFLDWIYGNIKPEKGGRWIPSNGPKKYKFQWKKGERMRLKNIL